MDPRPAFCKIMRSFFHSKICIPTLFASEKPEYLHERLTLESSLPGKSWKAEIEEIDGEFWISGQGWKNFVEENGVKPLDFLVFRFIADARVRVIIFGPDGSEKMGQAALIGPSGNIQEISDNDERGGDSGDDLPMNKIIASFTLKWTERKKFALLIKSWVAGSTGLNLKESVKVKNMEGEVHEVRLYPVADGRVGLGAGWPALVEASSFIVDKVYEFQFISSGDSHLVELIKVIRKD